MDMNRLKASAERIVMPEDMKERITESCVKYAEKQARAGSHGEQVSGVERVSGRRISHFAAGAAACAVLAGGIGSTVYLLSKNADNIPPLTSEEGLQPEAEDALDIYGFFGSDFYRKTHDDVSQEQQEEIRSYISGLSFEQSEQALDMLSGQCIEFRFDAKNAYYSVLIGGGHVMYEMSVQNENDTAYQDSIFYFDTHNDSTAYDIRSILGLTEEGSEPPFDDIAQLEYSYTNIAEAKKYAKVDCSYYGTSDVFVCYDSVIKPEYREMIAQAFKSCDWEQIPADITSDMSLRENEQTYVFPYFTDGEMRKFVVFPDNTICYSRHRIILNDKQSGYECADTDEHIFCYKTDSESFYEDFSHLMQDIVQDTGADIIPKHGFLQSFSMRDDSEPSSMQNIALNETEKAQIMAYLMKVNYVKTELVTEFTPKYTLELETDGGTVSYLNITDSMLIICDENGVPNSAYKFAEDAFSWWLSSYLSGEDAQFHNDAENYPPPYYDVLKEQEITMRNMYTRTETALSDDDRDKLLRNLTGYEWKNCAVDGEYIADAPLLKYVFSTPSENGVISINMYDTSLITISETDCGPENTYYLFNYDAYALTDYIYAE